MSYTKEQIVQALFREYEFLCHDDFDPDLDISPEDYLTMIEDMSYDDLLNEACIDENFTLDEFMEVYG